MLKKVPDNQETRSAPWISLGIFLCAFFLRVIYLYQIQRNSPFFDYPISDSFYYYQWAKQIAAGNWLGNKVFFRSPLYPYFLALIIKIFGDSLYIIRIIQAIIGSISCVLIYYIAKKVFNPFVGAVSALMALLYGPFIFYDGNLLIAPLLLFLNLMLVLALLRLRGDSCFKNWLITGILLGLAALARASVLLFIPFLAVWIWVTFRENGWKQVALNFLTICLGVGLIVLPVTIRNYLVGEDLVLIASTGGINFYIGNNSVSQGMYVSVKDTGLSVGNAIDTNIGMEAEAQKFAEKMSGKLLSPSQVSRFWYQMGFEFVKKNPFAYLKLVLLKMFLFLTAHEIPNILVYSFCRGFSSLLSLPLLDLRLINPLALCGIILGIKKWKTNLLLYLIILSSMLSAVIFFVSTRYRLPIIPFFIIFAAYALYWGAEKIKEKSYKPLLYSLIPLTIFALVSNVKRVRVNPSTIYYKMGVIYTKQGKYDEAVKSFKKVLHFYPQSPEVYYELGFVYARRQLHAKATACFEKAVQLDPKYVPAYYNLGIAYAQQQLYAKAADTFKKILDIEPDHKEAQEKLKTCLSLFRKKLRVD